MKFKYKNQEVEFNFSEDNGTVNIRITRQYDFSNSSNFLEIKLSEIQVLDLAESMQKFVVQNMQKIY